MTLQWKKYHPLSDQNAFICLVDSMGDDTSIVQAARVSYGKDERPKPTKTDDGSLIETNEQFIEQKAREKFRDYQKDRQLIRYLMNHSHTTPFEMVEFKFMVQVPMDCWRQWIRHRTASVNEYSTRYSEALDFFQVTQPTEWRMQAADNKQGSSTYLDDRYKRLKEPLEEDLPFKTPGEYLSHKEQDFQKSATHLYQERLKFGIAKEQARKDLPLSTYTRAYWKCDLHNIFNFLRLRMDSHAQLEIRSFANCMFEIVKQICPVACEAFEDYVLGAKKFSRMETEMLKEVLHIKEQRGEPSLFNYIEARHCDILNEECDSQMTDREWKEFLEKLK